MKNTVVFREAGREDAMFVADHLREADRKEVAALGLTPREAVEYSRQLSDFVWIAEIDGVPSMIFGCGCALTSPVAEVWALGTDRCTSAPRQMLAYGREKVREMLAIYPEMQNYCDARYHAAHRWLKKLGFTIHPAEPHGVNGELFCMITISKKEA
jgi:hypothetical protein